MRIINNCIGGDYPSHVIDPRLIIKPERGWNLNNNTGTNGIATWGNLGAAYVNKLNKDSKQCPSIGAITSATNSNYKFKYDGSLATTVNKRLAVYSKCKWDSTVVTYTITFTGYTSYDMLFLGNGSLMTGTYPSSNRVGFPLADGRGQVTWRSSDGGIVVNNSAQAGKTILVAPAKTVYVFTGSGTSYKNIDSFTLQSNNQTVTY